MKNIAIVAIVCLVFTALMAGCVDKDPYADNINGNSIEPSITPTTDQIADETPTEKQIEDTTDGPLTLYMADVDSDGVPTSRIVMDNDGTFEVRNWPLDDEDRGSGEWKAGGDDKYILDIIHENKVWMTINVKLLEDNKATFSLYYGDTVLDGTWEGQPPAASPVKKQTPSKTLVNTVKGYLVVTNLDITTDGHNLHVTGDVKNVGDVQLRVARVYMHLYNEDGRVIDSGMSIITNLAAGDTTDFSVSGDGNKYDDVVSYDVVVKNQAWFGDIEEDKDSVTIVTKEVR